MLFFIIIGVETVNNVVIVSDEQQRDSAVHIHVSILPQTPPFLSNRVETFENVSSPTGLGVFLLARIQSRWEMVLPNL